MNSCIPNILTLTLTNQQNLHFVLQILLFSFKQKPKSNDEYVKEGILSSISLNFISRKYILWSTKKHCTVLEIGESGHMNHACLRLCVLLNIFREQQW